MTDRNDVDRRQFLGVTAATGAAALVGSGAAGGQTTDDENTTTDDGTPSATDTETATVGDVAFPNATHRGVTAAENLGDLQFNPFNDANSPSLSQYLLFERFAQYNYENDEFVPAALTDWGYTGDAFKLTLREGMQWSNGDAVTAQDVAIQLQLAIETDDRIARWATSVDTPDDRTVVIGVDGDVNPDLLEADVFSERVLATYRGTYQAKLDAITNGDAQIDEITGFADTDPVTCGPFELEHAGDGLVWCSRFEGSPWADNVNFGHYELEQAGGNQSRQRALLNLEVDSDYSVAVSANTVANFPDSVEEVQYPDVYGVGITPNHADEYAGDRAVRQAMAYVIDREQCVRNSLPHSKVTPDVPTGIATGSQTRWLGDHMADFESYGKDQKRFEAAAEALRANGYSKVDGTWVDPDGDTVSIELTVPGGWSDWVLVCQTAIAHLDEFGFDASIVTTGNYFEDIQGSNFQFVAGTWLHAGPTRHPYFSLLHQLWEPQLQVPKHNYPPAKPDEAIGGRHETLSVPARNGGEPLEIDTEAATTRLAKATDEATEQDLVVDLAWAANQDLPMIPLTEKRFQSWITSDEWSVPTPLQDETEANVAYPQSWLPRKGMMNYDGDPAPPRTPIQPGGGPTVELSGPTELERGESAELDVVLSDGSETVDSYEVTVSADSGRAIVVGSTLPDGVTADAASTAGPGQSVTLAATVDGSFGDGPEPLTLGSVRVAGRETGTVTLSVALDSFAPDDGGRTPTGSQTTVEVTDSSLTPIDSQVPLDIDGDGEHEDLTANGQVDFQDVIQYFSNMQNDSLTGHTDAYDYSGNGEIDYQDLISLFQSI